MPTTAARRIPANGAELHVETAGEGEPIVFAHAGIADCRMWDPQMDAFAADHRVIRYDLRGYGQSTMPAAPFAHHDDLLTLFDALELAAATVVGASYGGEVAVAFALAQPERVRRLVLINTLAGMREPSANLRAGWQAAWEAWEAGDVEGALEMETRMWVDGPHRTPAQVDADLRRRVTAMNRAIFARADEHDAAEEREPEPPLVERLGEIAAPTLVLVGALDQPDALASADTLAAEMPDARLVSIDDTAHLPSMERPETVNRLLRSFLASP